MNLHQGYIHIRDIWKCRSDPGLRMKSSMRKQTCDYKPRPQTSLEAVMRIESSVQAECENALNTCVEVLVAASALSHIMQLFQLNRNSIVVF